MIISSCSFIWMKNSIQHIISPSLLTKDLTKNEPYSYEKLCVCNLTSSQENNMAMVFGDVLLCRLGRRAFAFTFWVCIRFGFRHTSGHWKAEKREEVDSSAELCCDLIFYKYNLRHLSCLVLMTRYVLCVVFPPLTSTWSQWQANGNQVFQSSWQDSKTVRQ